MLPEEALSELACIVKERGNDLTKFAYWGLRRTGPGKANNADVEEVVSEAVVRAVSIIRSTPDRVPDRTEAMALWLQQIVLYCAYEFARSSWKRRRALKAHAMLKTSLAYYDTIEFVDAHDSSAIMEKARSYLSEKEHAILVMYFLRHALTSEIATELGIEQDDVRQTRFRALKKLRKQLGELGA